MNKHIIKYTVAALFVLINALSFAQGVDSVMTMEGEFTGERKLFLRDANKISTSPLIKEQVVEMTTIQYSTLSTRRTVTIEPKPIAAAKINVEDKLPRLYRGYIRAGGGSYFTVPIDFYYTDGRSKKGTFGVKYHFLRSAGLNRNDDDSIPDSFSDNKVDLWGRRFFKKNTLEGGFGWERNVTHWYGFDNTRFTDADIVADSLRQRMNTFSGNASFMTFNRDSADINYRFDLAIRGTADLFEGKETNVDWIVKANKLMGTELFDAELGINYNTFSFFGPDMGAKGIPLIDEEGAEKRSTDNAVIRFNPSAQTVKGNLRAKVGFGFYLEARGDQPGHFYPQAEVSYNILKGLIVPYAGIRGSVEPTTYLGLYRENPFVQTFPELRNKNNKIDAYGGIGGAISKTVSFNAGVNYYSWGSFAYFVNDSTYLSDSTLVKYRSVGNKFNIIYDDLKALNFHGELALYSGDKWKANVRGDYYNYTTGAEVHAWNQPGLKFTASGQYKLKDKFIVGMDIFYLGSRWAKSLVAIEGVDQEPDGSYHYKLNGFTDVNLNVEYRYNKRISAWMQFNNALALKYQRYSQYNVQRFLYMIGASYSF
ncbi:MAG: hypothetical protein ACOYLH_12875 [Flavobacteriales bacterium]